MFGQSLNAWEKVHRVLLFLLVSVGVYGLYQSTMSLYFIRSIEVRGWGLEYWWLFYVSSFVVVLPFLLNPTTEKARQSGWATRVVAALVFALFIAILVWGAVAHGFPSLSLYASSEKFEVVTQVVRKDEKPFNRWSCSYPVYVQMEVWQRPERVCLPKNMWLSANVGDQVKLVGIENEFARRANNAELLKR